MASRLKEDEKNERIIRGLLKLPANRRCINCNSLGPQYVCTTFWTFVCTPCSGIHREFTHRVKSVSMAKFTSQEVASLQSGGNEVAKEIYFKELDSHRQPDSSNVDKLRDFIKHVYVDRRYTGEKSTDRPPPRMKTEETKEHSRTNSYSSESRSPPYEETYDRRYSDRPSPGYDGRRSPAYEPDYQRHSDYGRSPVRSVHGVVNDWRREDRFGNGRGSEDGRSPEGRSPDTQKVSSPPVIRPVRDILGDNVTPLRVIEPPKVSSARVSQGFPHTQRTASSSSLASSSGNPTEVKRVDSLIDFNVADPVPPKVVATQPQQSAAPTNTASDNWACFDNFAETSQPPPSLSPLDSGLTQLSAPSNTASLEDSLFGTGPQVSVTSSTGTTPAAPSLFPTNGAYAATPSNVTLPNNNSSGTPAIPGVAGQQQPIYSGSQFTSSFTGASSSQAQVSQSGPLPAQASSEAPAQPAEPKRRELPADIFTAMYAPQPVHAPGWHTGYAPHMGMPFPMQYNSAMQMPNFPPQSTKSANPFDVSSESPYTHSPAFPSMMPLQSALPNIGTATPSWMPSQASPYQSGTPQFTPQFGTTAVTPGTYINQQAPSNLSLRPQGFGGLSNDAAGYNTLGFPGNLSAPTAPSSSGNPFG